MASQSRPEPMNASPHHSKVKVSLTLSDPVFLSGTLISGKMQVESRADLDSLLGIGAMMVELFAIEEINSGKHSATSTFIHSRRIFQGPGLPPSNAVYSDYVPGAGELPLPAHHYAARRGQTTFFFRFPIPASSPSSINFGPASIRYEIRASVSVSWEGDRRLVTDQREVKIVESWDTTNTAPIPQAAVITEGGNIWAQATITNGVVVGGESACIDLQLKNHTQRWTSGVAVTLTRELFLSASSLTATLPPNILEVATQVEFRGPEYSVPPGVEGIARLVIDIPRHSRGVTGGLRVDDNGRTTEGMFEVRCALRLRIDMPLGSEDTVLMLPLIIYHSLAVPQIPTSPPRLPTPPYLYPVPSPGLPSSPPGTSLMPVYQSQQYGSAWPAPPPEPLSDYLPNPHLEGEADNWQDVPYSYAPPMQRSISVVPPTQAPRFAPGLLASASYTPSPRLLPPTSTHVSCTGYIYPGLPLESIDGFTSPDYIQEVINSPISPKGHPATHYHTVSPNLSSQSHAPKPLLPGCARPSPIAIPLPNPHDSQGIVHSPRPVSSPKPSFPGSLPMSDNITDLERMADEVGQNLGLDLPKGDADVHAQDSQGPKLDRRLDSSVEKTLPAPSSPSSKDKLPLAQRPRVDALFTAEATMPDPSDFPSSTDHMPHAPPTPPIAAITPVKFPKAPTELSGLGANLGKDVPPESGLDALERRLLAEVGTRKFDTDERPHVRSVVQPITIPPSAPPDALNDSAISSLTLADREGILKENLEREQEQDRDSDSWTQHVGGGRHSPSEDDRDARTQKGKSWRKLGKSKHSEEDLERAGRRRERKKAKDEEGKKLRREAKGRVAAWLGEIDVTAPVVEDPASFTSPTPSHFVPITESASFDPGLAETGTRTEEAERERRGDVSASPNPRSSGFVTISSLHATDGSSVKPSPRPCSVNDFRQAPTVRPAPASRSPSVEVKPTQIPMDAESLSRARTAQTPPLPPPPPPARLFAGRLPRFSPKPADPEVNYDVRSARGGKGGRVTQVASLWAAKVSASTKADLGPTLPNKLLGESKPKPKPPPKPTHALTPRSKTPAPVPAARKPKPALDAFKRSPIDPTGSAPGPGAREATKATTVPAVLSSSHAVPMLSSTASLARVKAHGAPGQGLGLGLGGQAQTRAFPPMISETISDLRSAPSKTPGAGAGAGVGVGVKTGAGVGPARLGELAFGQARLRDLIKKYQG